MSRPLPRMLRIVLVPIAVLGVAAAAFAGVNGLPTMNPHQMMFQHMTQELELTEDQVTDLEQIMDATHAEGEALRTEHEDLRAEGLAILRAETVDPAAIERQRQEMLSLANEGSALMTDALYDASQVLTYEQRLLLADKIEAFHEDGGPAGHFKGMHHRQLND